MVSELQRFRVTVLQSCRSLSDPDSYRAEAQCFNLYFNFGFFIFKQSS